MDDMFHNIVPTMNKKPRFLIVYVRTNDASSSVLQSNFWQTVKFKKQCKKEITEDRKHFSSTDIDK